MLVQVFLREKGYHCFFGLAEACFVLWGGGCCLNTAQTSPRAKRGLCTFADTSRDESQKQIWWVFIVRACKAKNIFQIRHRRDPVNTFVCIWLSHWRRQDPSWKKLLEAQFYSFYGFEGKLRTRRQQRQKKTNQNPSQFPIHCLPTPIWRARIFVIWDYGLWRNKVCQPNVFRLLTSWVPHGSSKNQTNIWNSCVCI